MKAICFTFDDGFRSHYDIVRPKLKAYGFNATFFITSSFIPRRGSERVVRLIEGYQSSSMTDFMTWDEVHTLHKDGFEIGSHLGRHVDMRRYKDEKLLLYAQNLDEKLVRLGIRKTRTLAYPSFFFDARVKAMSQKYGFELARSGCGVKHGESQFGGFGSFLALPISDRYDVNCSMVFGQKYGFTEFQRDIQHMPEDSVAILCFHDFKTLGLSVDLDPAELDQILQYVVDQQIRTVKFEDILSW